MRASLLLAAVCAALLPGSVAAQAEVVTMQLDSAVAMAKAQGYGQSGERIHGSLDEGGSEDVQADLLGGFSYLIVGVCDSDCTDLDLVLDDPAGNEVDSDLLVDDAPVVNAEVAQDGRYSVRVNMAACSVEPCGYGLVLFSKRQ